MKNLFKGFAIICWVASSQAIAAEDATKPGRVFKDCPPCPEMVVIPGGTFVMGSPPGEPGRSKHEGPQHSVTVLRFAMGRYEVTFAEWDACKAAGWCRHQPKDSGWGRERRPVINVSWSNAQQFAGWLNTKIGKAVYRLPSEAEWEYATRAGTQTAY